MTNDKDRNPQAGQNNDRQNQNRRGGADQQQAGQPGVNQNAQFQDRQNNDLHRDATKDMHDQLSGAAGDRNQQQAGKDFGNDRNRQADSGKDANRASPDRNAGGQQQAGQQGRDANRSGSAGNQGNQQK